MLNRKIKKHVKDIIKILSTMKGVSRNNAIGDVVRDIRRSQKNKDEIILSEQILSTLDCVSQNNFIGEAIRIIRYSWKNEDDIIILDENFSTLENVSPNLIGHKWIDENKDEIIALDAYLSILKGIPEEEAVDNAVDLVNRRSLRDRVPGVDFGSMKMKFQNNIYLDNKYLSGRGEIPNCSWKDLPNHSDFNKQIWKEYRLAPDKLKNCMAEIRKLLNQK